MKKNEKITTRLVALVLLVLIVSACEESETTQPQKNQEIEVSQEVKDKLTSLGFDVNGIEKIEQGYLVEGDIVLSDETISSMKDPVSVMNPEGEQYRTFNLVNDDKKTYILLAQGSNWSHPILLAVENAANELNAQNRALVFIPRTPGRSPIDYTITINNIYDNTYPYNVGGFADFPPGNGSPGATANFWHQTHTYDQEVINHVILHEIMHTLGFRHSDWFNRGYSCNEGGVENELPWGAEFIPGTVQYDPNSVMNSCFDGTETGELSSFDETAIKSIYKPMPTPTLPPRPPCRFRPC